MFDQRIKLRYMFTLLIISITMFYIIFICLFQERYNEKSQLAMVQGDFLNLETFSPTLNIVSSNYSSNNEHLYSKLADNRHLENSCRYPLLIPFDENIIQYLTTVRYNVTCKFNTPDLVSLQNGILWINQENAKREVNSTVRCRFRPIGGTLYKRIKEILPLGPWVDVNENGSNIPYDQIEVQCWKDNEKNNYSNVYNFSLAHIPPRLNQTFTANSEEMLSINIILLDSTSRNAFRRHMPLSWDFLVNENKFLDLEGLMKVGDNTVVNLIPLLAGLRFKDQGDDMPSEVPLGKPLDPKKLPFLWDQFRDKGCVTMLNDHPEHPEYGLFYNPRPEFVGYTSVPTDYWFRPWYMYSMLANWHRKSTNCFGNEFSYDLQLKLIDEFSRRYSNTCYFSFSLLSLAHDDSSNLDGLDFKMKTFLKSLFDNNALNNTVFIVMGDHGQRVQIVAHSYIGEIEERMPLFTVKFPQWFQQKYPHLIRNFQKNKYRVTSHFDIYQTLKGIADGNFGDKKINKKFPRQMKGVSLLHNVLPANRTCKEAHVPENHCTCLVPEPQIITENKNMSVLKIITEFTSARLKNFPECEIVKDIKIVNISTWTTSQLMQHGVRYMMEVKVKGRLKMKIFGAVEYYEVEYVMLPMNVSALIRLQHNKESQTLLVNVEPLILTGITGCIGKSYLPPFCKCIEKR